MKLRPIYVSIEDCADVQGVAVVVDVLRAFTTAAWAFHLGAARIVLSASTDEALALRASLPNALALKDSSPYDGFDLTNSPIQLQTHDLTGLTIIQRTTAGTVGAIAARGAERLYCASFVCASATARALRQADTRDVYFVVTGDGGDADEDRACAEYIATLIQDPFAAPEAFLRRARESNAARALAGRVAAATPGVDAGDLDSCLEVDRFDFAMRAQEENGHLVLRALRV